MLTVTADREEPRFEPRCPGRPAFGAERRWRETERAPAPARVSDAELLAAIGRDLAAVYAEVLRQPLPDRLVTLLEHIEANQKAAAPKPTKHTPHKIKGRGRR